MLRAHRGQTLRSGLSAKLADSVIIEMLDINMSGVEYRDAEVARVRFYPNGTCDELRIVLSTASKQFGIELEVIITGVADYGFFAQAEELPVEGLVHVSTLTDDYYHFDESSHSLIGRRTHRRYRLGDKVKVRARLPEEGGLSLTGTIVAADGDAVTIATEGAERRLAYPFIRSARTVRNGSVGRVRSRWPDRPCRRKRSRR